VFYNSVILLNMMIIHNLNM